ncbi:MAG: alpha/beta hydrolase [Pseudomonadota bacterium]
MPLVKLPNGIDLFYVTHGDLDRPAILICMGISDNITNWTPGLYDPLVDAGYCVVVFELRDSGMSTKFDDFGYPDLEAAQIILEKGGLPKAPYTAEDIAEDANLLLEHLGIATAVVIGYSLGSLVALYFALSYPKTTKGVVLLQGSSYNPDLPPRSARGVAALGAALVPHSAQNDQVQAMFNCYHGINGSDLIMDEEEAMQTARLSVGRGYCPVGSARLFLARMATKPPFDRLHEITCPALVLHGDSDPLFALRCGEELAESIPDARLFVIEGLGHNHPEASKPIIMEQTLNFCQDIQHS